MLYHTPDSRFYEQTDAEVWFDTEESAEAAGFSKPPSIPIYGTPSRAIAGDAMTASAAVAKSNFLISLPLVYFRMTVNCVVRNAWQWKCCSCR